jgi:hypothetical protein
MVEVSRRASLIIASALLAPVTARALALAIAGVTGVDESLVRAWCSIAAVPGVR